MLTGGLLGKTRARACLDPPALEVRPLRANPPFGDIYLQFRERDYGRIPLSGFIIIQGSTGELHEFKELSAALEHLTFLHNQRLERKQ